MNLQTIIKRLYWKWQESPMRDTIYWAFFFTVGLITVFHLVSSITASAVENSGFGIYDASTTAALVGEN